MTCSHEAELPINDIVTNYIKPNCFYDDYNEQTRCKILFYFIKLAVFLNEIPEKTPKALEMPLGNNFKLLQKQELHQFSKMAFVLKFF